MWKSHHLFFLLNTYRDVLSAMLQHLNCRKQISLQLTSAELYGVGKRHQLKANYISDASPK